MATLPERFCAGSKLKLFESSQIEFKENSISLDKLKKTVCAFLNMIGGYILIGIDDFSRVVGIDQKVADRLALYVDQIIRESMIVRDDGLQLGIDELSCRLSPIDGSDDVILIVQAAPRAGHDYRWQTGERFVRLNASNYCRRDEAAIIQRLKDTVTELKNEKGLLTSQLHTTTSCLRKATIGLQKAAVERDELVALHLRILLEKAEAEKALTRRLNACCLW